MMSKKQWFCLLLLFVAYLLMGATMFYNIERELELSNQLQDRLQRNHILDLLSDHYKDPGDPSGEEILDRLTDYCSKPVHNLTADQEQPLKWDFYNSVFFVITVVSTIGYGNLVATSSLSRVLMILYALIGIPMNGILLATLGEFFSIHLLRVHRRYKTQKNETRAGLVTDIVLYLIPGFVLFIFLPAGAFVYFEDWDYVEAVYYAFVTLTTIGFGDLVAGQRNDGHEEWYTLVYKACLIVWIVFGLGYIVMILGFITRAMRSKQIARLEHKLAANLRHTQSRIWSGVTKDMAYVRRVLNELYMLKMKPVYRDEDDASFRPRSRSNSLPTLAAGEPCPGAWRRRATSESLSLAGGGAIQRGLSDSDLRRIDRDATFGVGVAAVQPAELLARFVNALGAGAGAPEAPETGEVGGEHGLPDQDILASEAWGGSGWVLGGAPLKTRARAASEVHIDMDGGEKALPYNAEWTWSGVDASSKIHKMIRARQKSEEARASEKATPKSWLSGRRASFLNLGTWWKNPLTSRKTRSKAKSISSLLLQGRKRRQSLPEVGDTAPPFDPRSYLTQTAAGRNTIAQPPGFLAKRPSTVSSSQHDTRSFLEETTLGDLFRALTNIHTQMAAPLQTTAPPPPLLDLFTPPPHLEARRTSLRPPTPRRASLTPSTGGRRSSLRPPPTLREGRRFSVRPVTSSGGTLLPPQAPWMRLRDEGRTGDPDLAHARARANSVILDVENLRAK